MDELIDNFLDSYFTDEFIVEVKRSFSLFEFFEYNQAFSGFIDIISEQSNVTTDDLRDKFVIELQTKLNYILAQHNVKLIEDSTVYQKNEIILALAHLQNLEDYTGIIRCLESNRSDEEQFATIISDTSMLSIEEVLTILEFISPMTLETLKQFIYAKENEQEQSNIIPVDLLANFKMFHELNGINTLGAQLVENGVLMGSRFETYLEFIIGDLVTTDVNQTALNILSCIYLSTDGYNSPLLVYRKHSYKFIQDLIKTGAVETAMLSLIANFSEYKKVQIEKTRLS